MRRRGILLADGPSDLPLADHLETICSRHGVDVVITRVDPTLLPRGDRTVEGRLRSVLEQLGTVAPDIVFVHRDAEREDPDRRRSEIREAHEAVGLDCPVVPVVPVRMTEAWLLLDEAAIRSVAGQPRVHHPLDLPSAREAERIADPKDRLRSALIDASETSGTRRKRFARDFPVHRRLLLQRLDPDGPINELVAWQRLVSDTRVALAQI